MPCERDCLLTRKIVNATVPSCYGRSEVSCEKILVSSAGTIRQKRGGIGQHCRGAPQDSLHISDGDAVVCHRNILVIRAFLAVSHLTLVEHASAAVEDQPVRRKIFREFSPGGEFDFDLFASVFSQPAGELDRADVVTLSV